MNGDELTFTEYQKKAWETAIYPNRGNNLVYTVLGAGNEAGEISGKLKKALRDHNGVISTEIKQALISEVSDTLWYLAAICSELGVDFGYVAQNNLIKLADRASRGVLGGSGDNR